MVTGIPAATGTAPARSASPPARRDAQVMHPARRLGRHERRAHEEITAVRRWHGTLAAVIYADRDHVAGTPDLLTRARRRDRSDEVLAQRLRKGAR